MRNMGSKSLLYREVGLLVRTTLPSQGNSGGRRFFLDEDHRKRPWELRGALQGRDLAVRETILHTDLTLHLGTSVYLAKGCRSSRRKR